MFYTYADFVYLLRDSSRYFPWVIDADRCLRAWTPTGLACCPITAACLHAVHVYCDPGQYHAAARWLGLHRNIADAIALAADLVGSYNACIRAELVEAVGLDERWAPEGRWHDDQFHAHPMPHLWDRPPHDGARWVTTARPAAGPELWRCTSQPTSAPLPSPRKETTVLARAARSTPSGSSATNAVNSALAGLARGPRGSAI